LVYLEQMDITETQRKLGERLAAFDRKAISIVGEIEADFDQNPQYFSAIVGLASDHENNISCGATWLIKSSMEKGHRLNSTLLNQLAAGLDEITAWDAQLHICQSVRFFELSSNNAAAFSLWLRKLLDHDRPFVRAWSLDALCRIDAEFPDMNLDTAKDIAAALNDQSASVRARARNLISIN